MRIHNVEITEEVKEVLSQGTIEDELYFLPKIQLDRKQYVEVNQILELLGGKWNRGKKAHVFPSPESAQSILNALEAGEVMDKVKTFQFFETPKEVVQKMLELADIKTGMSVLEPSAGHGAIADLLPKDIELVLHEIDPEKCAVLESKGYAVDCIDFLSTKPSIGGFDRIVMNPPFTKGQDADHILHAWESLNEIGNLVSVASASVVFNSTKKYQKLRELIEIHGEIVNLKEGSFKESGTGVNTVLVILRK